MHQHREALGLEPLAATRRARLLHHELSQLLAHAVGRRLAVAALDVFQDSVPSRFVLAVPLLAVVLKREFPARRSLEQHLARGRGQVFPGGVQVELEGAGETWENDLAEIAAGLAPGEHHTFEQRQARVSQHELGIHLAPGPQPGTLGTRAERGVKRELARLELGQREPARGTGVALGEERRFRASRPSPVTRDFHSAVRSPERRLDRVRQAAAVGLAHRKSVDHDGDVVVLPAIQLGHLGQVVRHAVDAHAYEALFARRFEHIAKLTLAPAHQRRQYLDLRPLGPLEHQVGDLRCTLALDRRAVLRTVRGAEPRPQQAQVVVDLGNSADRGAGVVAGRLLLDRDRRGQALDRVYVGLFHEPEKLAGVRGQRFDVAPLAFGVDGVERERRLAGARQSRDDGEAVPRDLDGDVLEVVLAGAPHDQRIARHRLVG